MTLKKVVLLTNDEIIFKKVVGELIGDKGFEDLAACTCELKKGDNWIGQ